MATRPDIPPTTRQRAAGVGSLAAAMGIDAGTTLYGLRLPGVVELNPITAGAMRWLGRLPGLAALIVASLLGIVLVTEATVHYCRGRAFSPGLVRALGYGPPTAISTVAAVNNLAVAGAI